MSEHTSHHAGHAGHTLQKDEPCDPFFLCHGIGVWVCACVWPIPCDKVHSPTKETDCAKGELVGNGLCISVRDLDRENLFLCVPLYPEVIMEYMLGKDGMTHTG